MANSNPEPESSKLTDAQRAELSSACVAEGERVVAQAISVSPETIARLTAGFSVRRGTLKLAVMYLEARAKNAPAPVATQPVTK